jgi:PAS domain S-box-containing protein
MPMPVKKNINNQIIQQSERFDQSEARFRTMFDTAAVGIGMMSLDRKLIDANPALCRMFGLSREELIGKVPVIVTYPEDYPASTHQFEDLLSGNVDSFWGERRYLRKNGEMFWANVTMSIVRDALNKPLYLVGMVIDIDDQKKTLAELQQSEARFRTIFENASIGIALVGLDTIPISVNPAILSMTGYTKEELLARSGLELSYPEDRELAVEPIRELAAGKKEIFQIESRFVRKNGQVYWVRQRISTMPGPDGKPAYIVVMVEDIDEQKRVFAELQQSEMRFRAMFDNVSVGMSLMGLNRRVMSVNQAAERIIGYPAEELPWIDISDLTHPEDREIGKVQYQELISGKRDSLRMEKRYVRKNGDVFWARVTYSLVRNSNGQPQYLVGSIEDIDDQKLGAEKLAAQEADNRRTLELHVEERTHDLKEANLRLVDEIEQRQVAEETLATKVAEEAITSERTRLARDLHDAVTQTLFSASLIAEVLPELWEVNPEEARKSNEELRQLTRGALAEMRTLLLELRPATLTQARFQDLIKQLSEALVGRARLPVELVVSGEYDLPPDIKVAFYRIAQESLNNIVKYSRATQVEIRIGLDCCNVHLEIKDNGIGFDPSTVKPTSMGMRIMRERAEAIHAQLQVSSHPGQGTTVSVDWNEDEIIPRSEISIRGKS